MSRRIYSLLLATISFIIFGDAGTNLRKIAVVGGGPAGLGVAVAMKELQSLQGEITVFDNRYDILQTNLGGGLQLSGGAVVLQKLGLLGPLQDRAERMSRVLSRGIDKEILLDMDIDNVAQRSASNQLCDSSGQPMIFSIMRDNLQDLLYKTCTSNNKPNVQINFETEKRCTKITESKSGKISLEFADGSTFEGFDFVVGADGAGSVVRQSAVGEETLIDVPDFASQYSGIRIAYGVTNPDNDFLLRPEPGSRNAFHQWFGDGCYALTASYGGLQGVQHMIAVVYRDEDNAVLGENPEWGQSSMKAALLSRLVRAGFADNHELLNLVKACQEGRFIDLGIKNRPAPLKKWACSSGRIILVGDSAHSMPPFLGQGANQALQDAYFIAQGIKEINTRLSSSPAHSLSSDETSRLLQKLARKYEDRRRPHTALMTAKSIFLGQIETLSGPFGVFFRNNFFRLMGKLGIAEAVFIDGAIPKI